MTRGSKQRNPGSIWQNKRGGFTGAVSIPRRGGDSDRRYRSASTWDEVRNKLDQLLADVKRFGSDVTVERWLSEWLERDAAPTVSPETLRGYRTLVCKRIIPALGTVRLRDLTATGINRAVSKWIQETSPTTANHARAVLRVACEVAIKEDLLDFNPVAATDAPKIVMRQILPTTDERARAILVAVDDDPNRLLYRVAMLLGIRQGELLAIRWVDIDDLSNDTPILKVMRKSRLNKVRLLPLPDVLVCDLRRYRIVQRAMQENMGPYWRGDGRIFCDELGDPLRGSTVTTRFQRLLVDAGLPCMRFDDLRHSAATLALAAGVPMRVVQNSLGHSSIVTTSGNYTDLPNAFGVEQVASNLTVPRQGIRARVRRIFGRSAR